MKNENKVIIQTNGNGDLNTVVYTLYGKETADCLVTVDYKYEDIQITGVVGKPEIARSNKSYQMFFVNKRFIKDKTLTAGAEQAFKGLLPIGKFGFLILNLEMDPRKIDVNVHPTKLEIRFQEEQKVFKAVYHAIRDSLLKIELVRNAEQQETSPLEDKANFEDKQKETKIQESKDEKTLQKPISHEPGLFGFLKKKTTSEEIKEENDNFLADIFSKKTKEQYEDESQLHNQFYDKEESKEINIEQQTSIDKKEDLDFNEMYSKTFGKEIKDVKKEDDIPKFENISLFEEQEAYEQLPEYKYCGTVFSTYIIIEMNNEMYIIDQHAAHERIMYEKIKKNYYENNEKDSQILLLPDIINLSYKEKSIVKENIDMFTRAGFMIEEFGENTIRLIGVPTVCVELDTKELFLEILDAVNTVAITAIQEKEDKFIATVACKAAVKANHTLNEQEVKELMNKLLKLPNPFTCPHGRPTAIKMSKYDIEKKFNRK